MKEKIFCYNKCLKPKNPPDELAQNVSKKKKHFSDEFFLQFPFEGSEFYRVFNYLHDSNSIFRAAGIISKGVFERRVTWFVMPFKLQSSVFCFSDVD